MVLETTSVNLMRVALLPLELPHQVMVAEVVLRPRPLPNEGSALRLSYSAKTTVDPAAARPWLEKYFVEAAGLEPAQAYLSAGDLQSLELYQCSALPQNTLHRPRADNKVGFLFR